MSLENTIRAVTGRLSLREPQAEALLVPHDAVLHNAWQCQFCVVDSTTCQFSIERR